MEINYDKCPECGYVNKNRPNVCPSCGCNLLEHRKKLQLEEERLKKIKQEQEIYNQKNAIYKKAVEAFIGEKYDEAYHVFFELGDFRDSKAYVEKCKDAHYQEYVEEFCGISYLVSFCSLNADTNKITKDIGNTSKPQTEEDYIREYYDVIKITKVNDVKTKFESLKTYKDSTNYVEKCKSFLTVYNKIAKEKSYEKAVNLFNSQEYKKAKAIFSSLYGYQDSKKYIDQIDEIFRKEKEQREREIANEAARREREREEQNRLRLIEQDKIERRDKTISVLQFIALSLPIATAIGLGVILFINADKIKMLSNFGGWIAGWVFYSLAAIIGSIILIRYRTSEWDSDDKQSHIFSIITLLYSVAGLIFVGINSPKLINLQNPVDAMKIRAMDKDTTVINFELYNGAHYNIRSIYGDMYFYLKDTEIATYYVTFNYGYVSSNPCEIEVDFYDADDTFKYADYSQLTIKYNITKMWFGDSNNEVAVSGKTITCLLYGSNDFDETMTDEDYVFNEYTRAFDLYMDKNYEEAYDICKNYQFDSHHIELIKTIRAEINNVAETYLPDQDFESAYNLLCKYDLDKASSYSGSSDIYYSLFNIVDNAKNGYFGKYIDYLGLNTFTVPLNSETLSSGAIKGSSKLETLIIPEGITSIEAGAIDDNYSLTSITFPSSLKSINSRAVTNNIRLEEVDLSPCTSLTTINEYAFIKNPISTITLNDKIASIGTNAFTCSTETQGTIYFKGSSTTWNSVSKHQPIYYYYSEWYNKIYHTVICDDKSAKVTYNTTYYSTDIQWYV